MGYQMATSAPAPASPGPRVVNRTRAGRPGLLRHRMTRAAGLKDPAQFDGPAGQAGSVDVLVNNAGFSWIGPTADLDAATFDRLYAANVRAPYFLVAALAPAMAARGSGSIINVGSQSGQIAIARPAGRTPSTH